jgi:hypothetical protein
MVVSTEVTFQTLGFRQTPQEQDESSENHVPKIININQVPVARTAARHDYVFAVLERAMSS